MTPMHLCLNITEIASLICFHGFEGWAGRRSIVAFARTCRAFYEPAMNAIWNEIPNIRPLLDLLPKEMWERLGRVGEKQEDKMLEILFLANWSRFEEHARRVRVYGFQYGKVQEVQEERWYPLHLLVEHRGRALLPNVEKIYLNSINAHDYISLPLVTTTKLKLFHCVPNGDADTGLIHLLDVLESLGERYPALQKLVLNLGPYTKYHEVASTVTTAIDSGEWLNLSYINVYPATSVALKYLPRLPALEYLKINIDSAPDLGRTPRLSMLPPPDQLYPSLKTIDLLGRSLSTTMENLKSLPKGTHIKSATFTCRDAAASESSRWSSLCEMIEERCDHLTLEQLSIIDSGAKTLPDDARYTIAWDQLKPLRSFNYLTQLKIQTPGVLNLDDSNFSSLVLSWPRIQLLALVGETPPDTPPKITLKSLVFIAENCPDLESLYLLFDAQEVPTFPPGDPPTSCKALHHLSVIDSPLSHIQALASLMYAIFPNLQKVVTNSQLRRAEPQREVKLMQMWDKVQLRVSDLAFLNGRRR